MKKMILIFIIMFTVGYLVAEVTGRAINCKSIKREEIVRNYYPALYKIKERVIYPIHNRDRIKSYERGMNGVQVTQIRSGYKVKK
jgi:hypothetical protein